MKSHLKRLFTPKSWNILKKERKFITRPFPGMHPFKEGLSLNTLLKEVMGYAKTTKEVLNMLNKKEILVDKKRRKEKKFLVGLMDFVDFPQSEEAFRIIFNEFGKISVVNVPKNEIGLKLCKVKGKNLVKGKVQLSTTDGRSILTDKKDIKTGDSVLIELPSQKISQHLKFEPGCLVYFTAGKKIGQTAKLKEVKKDKIICTAGDSEFETSKSYAFVVGKDKPVILIKNE